jgi:hypothetical protein
MASEEKKARDREIQQLNLFKARGAGPTQAETNMFRCGKVSTTIIIGRTDLDLDLDFLHLITKQL